MKRFATALVFAFALLLASNHAAVAEEHDTYDKDEIFEKATGFFGEVGEGLAKAGEKAFADQGRPNAYVAGEEAGGAIGVGLRYGRGKLDRKTAEPRRIFRRGPSIGFDVGGDASKVFVLIYNPNEPDSLFRRFPGVDGSLYFVAGFGIRYESAAGITLARIRSGVGLRAAANVGYTHYTKKHSWLPV